MLKNKNRYKKECMCWAFPLMHSRLLASYLLLPFLMLSVFVWDISKRMESGFPGFAFLTNPAFANFRKVQSMCDICVLEENYHPKKQRRHYGRFVSLPNKLLSLSSIHIWVCKLWLPAVSGTWTHWPWISLPILSWLVTTASLTWLANVFNFSIHITWDCGFVIRLTLHTAINPLAPLLRLCSSVTSAACRSLQTWKVKG